MSNKEKKEEKIISIHQLEDILIIFAETPLFAGGEREESVIDLTLQRDKLTELPIVRGTSIKGPFRALYELRNNKNIAEKIFGSEDKAGEIIFLDAFLLLFPVSSDIEPIIFVTSPLQINEFNRLLAIKGESLAYTLSENLDQREDDKYLALAPKDSWIVGKELEILNEFSVKIKNDENLSSLINKIVNKLPSHEAYSYIKEKIRMNTLVVSDRLFKEIVERGLIRVTRIRVNYDTKAVERGALFMQELLPQYTILASGILTTLRSRSEQTNNFINELKKGVRITLGGDETTGKGLVHCML